MAVQKRNEANRPRIEALEGHTERNIADYDGIISIGSGEFEFETKWDQPSEGTVRAYNDGKNIVAVAVGERSSELNISDIVVEDIAGFNFTSRARIARVGDLVVFENEAGRYLAIAIREIRRISDRELFLSFDFRAIESEGEDDGIYSLDQPLPDFSFDDEEDDVDATYLTDGEGRHLTTGSGERVTIAASEQPPLRDLASPYEPLDIQQAAADAFRRFESLSFDAAADYEGPGLGHNNPPPDFVRIPAARSELASALEMLVELHPGDRLDAATSKTLGAKLIAAARQITAWIAPKLDKTADGFFEEVGKSGAKGLVAVLGFQLLSSELYRLAAMIASAFGH